MPTIFDNIETPFLPAIRDALGLAYRGDFCVGYFNLRGWRHLAGAVDAWPGGDRQCARLLVGMTRTHDQNLSALFGTEGEDRIDNKEAVRRKKEIAGNFRRQLTIGLPTDADQAGLRSLSAQLRNGKLAVKLHLRHPLHAKLYLAHRRDQFHPVIAFLGSSNLTFSGLSGQGELNVDVMDGDAAQKLCVWFEDRWADAWCLDISAELAEIIDESWAGETAQPFHIYLKIAWHLSRDARDGNKEFRLPADVAHDLMPFQTNAVKLACRRLNQKGGVLVGDVVGLGKTRVASAIARVMGDDHFLETLILCPKNLKVMWKDYAHRYKLRAHEVMSHSEVLRNLNDRFPRYRLVIIDESHNFRNREGRTYQAIRTYLERNESKVVLLSATPYNKTYLDLANQLRLFLSEQQDIGIRPELLLKEMGESQFSLKHPNIPLASLAAFEESEHPDDWRDVMRLFMVRRTRGFIIRNYAETDTATGRPYLTLPGGVRVFFPVRQPCTVRFRSDPEDPDDPCGRLLRQEVVDIIDDLELPRYGLALYKKKKLPADLSAAEIRLLDDLTRAGKRLKGFCRTNLFKRLESSGEAFRLSLHRHVLRNYLFLHALRNDLPLPIGQQAAELLDTRFNDLSEGELNLDDEEQPLPPPGRWSADDYRRQAGDIYDFLRANKQRAYRWVRPGVFEQRLSAHLQADASALHGLLDGMKHATEANDFKLRELINILSTHRDRKFLVFTQFADTALYLNAALHGTGFDHVDCATGQSENPAAQAWKFSPESNDRLKDHPPGHQTRILIATDVLSEGQNLQDSFCVVNYDLPWALIRLVQRAGRVDRIGQKADTIFCYSFFPSDGVERIIRLRQRLLHRLRENEEVVGSDESFFEGQTADDEKGLQNLYNENSGVLDEPYDDEVDLTSEAYEIWAAAIKEHPSLRQKIESLPDVVYSTKPHTPDPERPAFTPLGVLVYVRTAQENDALLWLDEFGQAVTESPVRVLRAAACTAETPALPRRPDHHSLVAKALTIVNEERSHNTTGQLGRKTGARYRTYERLNEFLRHRQGDLFLTDHVRAAIQAVYDHPLTTEAADKLNRQLRIGVSDDDLAALVTGLHKDDRLVLVNLHDPGLREPRIVCSLGLSNTASS
jgi:superfamily II DNA or RNA helicase